MNIYRILKLFASIKSSRIRLIGLLLYHYLGKRYVGVFFDPVLGCNLKCRMCYFSGDRGQKMKKGIMPFEQVEAVAKAVFPKAMKLQIGCGAEPTLYNRLVELVAMGKGYGVPYISITTNGNLLRKEVLCDMIDNGLDEITISAHGLKNDTYEYFMTNAKYQNFLRLLSELKEVKAKYPKFKIRVNYTVNEDNVLDLKEFWSVFGGLDIDVLEIRPIQNIGGGAYDNYSLDMVVAKFDIISDLAKECEKRNVITLIPKLNHLENDDTKEIYGNQLFASIVHCYISPGVEDGAFDYERESISMYHRRCKVWTRVWKAIFSKNINDDVKNSSLTKMFKYS